MSEKTKNNRAISRRINWLWIIVLTPIVSLLLMLTLTAMGTFGRLPSFEELENPKSNIATEIFSEDGKVLGTFYIENRSYMQYAELFARDSSANLTLDGYVVPPIIAALISTEDERFRTHGGVDVPSLFRVGIKTIALRNSSQGGGSTITQQLAKNLFPRDTARNQGKVAKVGKLVVSKFKEWITAGMLEYNYTKEEIATMYLNTVTYGSNAYGVKSAAQTFFNKLPSELNIQEAAVLVGVVNAPTRYSPVRNPESAMARRNVVINRLAKTGAITEQMCDSLSKLPIELDYSPVSNNAGEATYFREMLRLTMTATPPVRSQFFYEWDYEQALKQYNENPIYGWCHKNKKADGSSYNIYRDGLKIYTTINSVMQAYAEESVQKQMVSTIQPKMDEQYKQLGTIFIDADKELKESIISRAISGSERYSQMLKAGISKSDVLKSFDNKTKMKLFTYRGVRDTVMTPRDSVLHMKRMMRASFVAMEPQTGSVKAYVGGTNFRYFKYDMAKQGKRQMGSTIKPFIYTFAIDHLGFAPCTKVPNLPVTIETTNGTPWSPKESGNVVYDGELKPLSWGLAMSRNNYSAWVMKQAKQPKAVADFIHNVGIKSFIDPVPSLCLGVAESNVFEMVGAYSTFVNRGVYTEPIFVTRIEDRQGNLISSFVPKSQDAISERTAYTMLGMLQGVVNGGTAGRLNWMYGMYGFEAGGKTGTSQKNRDAWFMCVLPKLVAGAWVGGEDQVVHLLAKGEGSVMALPIVGEFLNSVYKNGTLGVAREDKFLRPANLPKYNCEEEQREASTQAKIDAEVVQEPDFFE
ncbi:MAG: transglycosylase domain-containing protein [Rikenellaceae bacterium]